MKFPDWKADLTSPLILRFHKKPRPSAPKYLLYRVHSTHNAEVTLENKRLYHFLDGLEDETYGLKSLAALGIQAK